MPEVPKARPALLGDLGPGLMACEVEQCSQATRAQFRGPAGSSGSPGDSGSGISVRGGDKLSRVTRARFQGPVVSTSSPAGLTPGYEVP